MKVFSKERWTENMRHNPLVKTLFSDFEKWCKINEGWVNDADGAEVKTIDGESTVTGKSGLVYTVQEEDTVEKEEEKPRAYQILIECDGDSVTIANMLVNGKIVKSATAKRNPEDKFSFKIGAETAFNRLFEKELQIGDKVIFHGLVRDKNLNGRHGEIVDVVKSGPRKGCFIVRMKKSGMCVIQPKNLKRE